MDTSDSVVETKYLHTKVPMIRALQVSITQANNAMAEARNIVNYEKHRRELEAN
jgi:hypothetical protein